MNQIMRLMNGQIMLMNKMVNKMIRVRPGCQIGMADMRIANGEDIDINMKCNVRM
jgi:hypothetical protein